MSCPTCDHTLEGIGGGTFWCPRCGTIARHPRVILGVPKLVERCRKFEQHFRADEDAQLIRQWESVGVEESIRTPEARGG